MQLADVQLYVAAMLCSEKIEITFNWSKMNLLASFGKDSDERMGKALEKLRQGQGVLVVDDENRENEGDLIYPAGTMTEKDMALMIRECSGIICLCLPEEKCQSLGLRPMVSNNTSKNQTAFTISIEAKKGVSTGVSAKDRLTTINAAIAENAKPEDLASPGHVFPLMTRKNGVLERRGHTEATVDLVRLAGLGEYGVLSELTNEDGTMSRLPEICDFAQKHNMTVVSIEDICAYRQRHSI